MTMFVAIIVAFAGVIVSAICSGLETGLYVVNRVRLAVRAGRGDRAAIRLERELERPDRLLATLLITNNAANYAGSLGVAAIIAGFAVPVWAAVALNTLIVVPLLFVFGETIPKDLFRTRADSWLPRFGAALTGARRLLTMAALVPLLATISTILRRFLGDDDRNAGSPRARIARFIRESHASGSLSEAQLDLAGRALAMRQRTVASEMTPWRQVASLKHSTENADVRAIARSTLRSRLPVVADGRVAGFVEVQHLLVHGGSVAEALDADVPRFPPTARAFSALEVLRRRRRPMGVVEDAEGKPLGIVTLKDLVEPLIGDLRAW